MNRNASSLEEIFSAAHELEDPAARAAYLDVACGSDTETRRRVERLLEGRMKLGRFLESPALGPTIDVESPRPIESPGATIGPYTLAGRIGEGGMGVVYRAEQSQPLRRTVALKVIKPGMDSAQVIARFEAERQALAMMDHPNIARVLDAGTTASGRPYFVMELVKGVPITDFCDREGLSIGDRLDLFVLACRAVQHAHQKGVIHRDLKPSNVLVTVLDGSPVPKVIDFGIAKATGGPLTERTRLTDFSQLVGTPLYMSPEQAELTGVDIDTRSDIYSLGVLLYELLTGTTPFDGEALHKAAFDEMRRIIREEEPPKPSTRLSSLGESLTDTSARRKSDPRRLGSSMRGELDWIVMKALEKDRRRRYETAGDFAADVMRHLSDRPVEACPPSAKYRLAKLARRHRIAVIAGGLMVLALAAASGVVGYIASERDALRQAGAEALAQADRWGAASRRPEELEAVKRAEALLEGGRGGEGPLRVIRLRRADLEMVLGLEEIRLEATVGVKDDEFDWGPADRLYAEAFRTYGIDAERLGVEQAARRLPGRSVRSDLVAALDDWARVRRSLRGRDDASWKWLLAVARAADLDPWRDRLRAALLVMDLKSLGEIQESTPRDRSHPSDIILLTWIVVKDDVWSVVREAQRRRPNDFWLNHSLGLHLQRAKPPRPEEALGFYRAAVALRPESPGATLNLGTALRELGRLEEAIAANGRAIRLKPDFASAHNNLGIAFLEGGKIDDAIAAFKASIRLDPAGFAAHLNLSRSLYEKNHLEDAAAAAREAHRLRPSDPGALHNFGTIVSKIGAVDEAEKAFRESIRLRPNDAASHNGLGALLCDQRKDFDGAIASFRRALAIRPDHGRTRENLGNALLAKGDLRGATVAYREAVRLEPRSAQARCSLGIALGRQGKLDEAVADLTEAARLDPELARAHCNLGVALTNQGRADEAVAALRRAIALAPADPEAHYALGNSFVQKRDWEAAEAAFADATRQKPDYAEAYCNLGQVLREQGRFREALAALRRGHELGSKGPSWRYPSSRWIKDCEALIEGAGTPTAADSGRP